MSSRSLCSFLACLALLAPLPARADRGALTLSGGGGGSVLSLPPPYVPGGKRLAGTDMGLWAEGRYALANWLELSVSGFYELPATFWHNGVEVETASGSFPGSLSHRMQRFGALAGARLAFGMVWRPVVSLEAGWSHRSYSELQHVDDSDPGKPRDWGLSLGDISADNFVLSAGAGLGWSGDHLSVDLLPRAQLLLGPEPAWTLVVPLTLGWSWYL